MIRYCFLPNMCGRTRTYHIECLILRSQNHRQFLCHTSPLDISCRTTCSVNQFFVRIDEHKGEYYTSNTSFRTLSLNSSLACLGQLQTISLTCLAPRFYTLEQIHTTLPKFNANVIRIFASLVCICPGSSFPTGTSFQAQITPNPNSPITSGLQ